MFALVVDSMNSIFHKMHLKECLLTYGVILAHCVLEQFVKGIFLECLAGQPMAIFIAAEKQNCTFGGGGGHLLIFFMLIKLN